MNRLLTCVLASCGWVWVAPGHAEPGFAVGIRASTLGLGVEATAGLVGDWLSVRGGLNGFRYGRQFDSDDVDSIPENDLVWEGDLQLQSGSLLADLHPAGGGFRISGGLVANGNRFGATTRCEQAACEVGGHTFTAEQIGNLSVDVDWESTAPYLGIGFGNAVARNKSVALSFDLGVVFQGAADVEIATDSASCNNDVRCRAAIEEEEQELEGDTREFNVYPVLSIGVTFRLM